MTDFFVIKSDMDPQFSKYKVLLFLTYTGFLNVSKFT